MTKLSPTSARRTKRSTGVDGSTSVPGAGVCITTEPSVPPGEKTPNEWPSTRPAALRRTSTVWIDLVGEIGHLDHLAAARQRHVDGAAALGRSAALGDLEHHLAGVDLRVEAVALLAPVDGDTRRSPSRACASSSESPTTSGRITSPRRTKPLNAR